METNLGANRLKSKTENILRSQKILPFYDRQARLAVFVGAECPTIKSATGSKSMLRGNGILIFMFQTIAPQPSRCWDLSVLPFTLAV